MTEPGTSTATRSVEIPVLVGGGEITDPWTMLAIEALDHWRLPYRLGPATDTSAVVVVLRPDLMPAAMVEQWVMQARQGATVIVCGASPAVAALVSATPGEPVERGHVVLPHGSGWGVADGASLPAFGGHRLVAGPGAEVLATWHSGEAAIVRSAVGAGAVIVLGVDLWQSVGRIHQGFPVHGIGTPAQDGSAEIGADGILRCDDGLALDLETDRVAPVGHDGPFPTSLPSTGPVPYFATPAGDQWRELFLHLLWGAADAAGALLPWLHYWPAGVEAVGHMSHDSDLNVDEHALLGLDVFARADVVVTWCHCWPGGYSPQTVAAIGAAGHEHALHYNALDIVDGMPWGHQGLADQHRWAEDMTGATIVSNKNHYTRWQGWDEFYAWCDDVGIQIDQSRGPSKPGVVGFPYGSCHVTHPVSPQGRRYQVLSLPFQTQDVGWQTDESLVEPIIDAAAAAHGVAHFLFHTANMPKTPRVAAAVASVAAAGRSRGLPWWTSGQINAYERARRGVSISGAATDESTWALTITARADLPEAALVLAIPPGQSGWSAHTPDGPLASVLVRRHGRDCLEVAMPLTAGSHTLILTSDPGASR